MAKFNWENQSQEELVKLKNASQAAQALEYMVCDPKLDPDLHLAQKQILMHLSDEELLLKIKGNISRIMSIENGIKTIAPAAQLIRGLHILLQEAQGRVQKSPWDHESLDIVERHADDFYKKIRQHEMTPDDIMETIPQKDVTQRSWPDLLKGLFGIDLAMMTQTK